MQKLVSVDFRASFGFMKKPDINDGMYLTYNMLHKPALLGIFGAIAGLEGYAVIGKMGPKDVPQYRKEFDGLQVAILPLESMNGNFTKDVIRYTNTVGYANADGTLIVDEQTLVRPAYRVFVVLDDEVPLQQLLLERLKNGEAEYVPYLGKNEHQLCWNEFKEWEMEKFEASDPFVISSIFQREGKLKTDDFSEEGTFMYFENLPKGFQEQLPQYELGSFSFTDYELSPETIPNNLFKINGDAIIQLF